MTRSNSDLGLALQYGPWIVVQMRISRALMTFIRPPQDFMLSPEAIVVCGPL
jgi:hypothetical protein